MNSESTGLQKRTIGPRSAIAGVAITLAGVALAVPWATPLAAAAPGESGDPATIAFDHTLVAATEAMPGEYMVQTGYYTLNESGNGTWSAESDAPPSKNYIPVSDHVTIAARGGRVLWVSDVMVPLGFVISTGGSWGPIELVLTSRGLFSHILSGSGARSCWDHAHGSVIGYTRTGVPSGYSLGGRVSPMRRAGGTVYVKSTYPWWFKQTATEVDTISSATRLPSASVVHVSGAPGHPAFVFRQTVQWLKTPPVQPKVPLCASVER